MNASKLTAALATMTAALALSAAPSLAATPFTAGTGSGWDLAVGSDGTGHAVMLTDEPGDRVRYCRVPAGGTGCDGESDYFSFPNGAAANAGDDAQVFTPTPNKVVILASCYVCGSPADSTNRTYRWISTNNGVSFGAAFEVGDITIDGEAAYLNTGDIGLGVEGSSFQALDASAPTAEVDLGGGFPFVYSASVALVPDTKKAVYAVNSLDNIKYSVFRDPDADPIAGSELNTAGNWFSGAALPADEGDNDETHLSSGPWGTYLSYGYFVPNNEHVGLRKFDPATETFSAPTYIEGASTIDDNGAYYPHHSQDASGRLHATWRSLYDDGRLRYTRSDDGGATWSAVSNIAVKETFIDPIVEAGPAGTGFAVWGYGAGGATTVRMVPLDPQFEADPATGGPGGSDASSPSSSGLKAGDSTLFPGQGTKFTFNSSEAGRAVLTVQKRVKGLKLKVKGKRRCVAKSAKRVRKAPAKKRCKTWKKIGSIRKQVKAGRNTIAFSGRLAGRKLGPGRYRALLKITDLAGNVSRAETAKFKVIKPKKRK
ncbi:MAG: hypothetical protein M3550_05765 [Actinomycetota bacterium]|nr:hypothetical protein [Actinomycetota bacterium]